MKIHNTENKKTFFKCFYTRCFLIIRQFFNATKRSHFCIGLLLVMKKAEYSWCEGNALYLVGTEGCAVLWAAETGWNHQWRKLPNTIRLKRAKAEKRPEYATTHEAIIFHHDNARSHVAIPVKNYLKDSGWEVLPHPPYSPDLAPSDYHLFRSMQNALTGIRFTSGQGIKKWLDSFLTDKPAQFFWNGIDKLPERWEKVIASDGQYSE